ncbi:MAG: hypothetical protein V1644_03435 [Candidatus Micrarchaeota archaeon]
MNAEMQRERLIRAIKRAESLGKKVKNGHYFDHKYTDAENRFTERAAGKKSAQKGKRPFGKVTIAGHPFVKSITCEHLPRGMTTFVEMHAPKPGQRLSIDAVPLMIAFARRGYRAWQTRNAIIITRNNKQIGRIKYNKYEETATSLEVNSLYHESIMELFTAHAKIVQNR